MTRKVSNSEVQTFLLCRQRYHLAHDLNLEPIHPGPALYRGSVGHEMLEAYYRVFIGLFPGQKTPEVYAKAEAEAWAVYRKYFAMADMSQNEVLVDLRQIMKQYFEYARSYKDKTSTNSNQREWVILQVEKYYELDLTDEYKYVARLDLAARIDGLVTIVDHKFVYDFWTQDKLDLNPQLPKYTGILRNNGIRVDQVMVNQIRYRPKKKPPFYSDEERFKYSFSIPTDMEVRTHLKEQLLVSEQVVAWRDKPMEERAATAVRILNDMVCRGCPVKSLCIMGLKGIDFNNEIKVSYQPNTYDYNSRSMEESSY